MSSQTRTEGCRPSPGAAAPSEPAYAPEAILAIAAKFGLADDLDVEEFASKGNINSDTYLVRSGPSGARRSHLVQRLNDAVFTRPDRVMAAMDACLAAQRQYLAAEPRPGGRDWQPMDLLRTQNDELLVTAPGADQKACWRCVGLIEGCHTYKSLSEIGNVEDRLRVAEEAARGLAIFGDATSSIDVARLADPLPGYRNTRMYFDQMLSILRGSRSLAEAAPYLPEEGDLRDSTAHLYMVALGPRQFRHRLEDPELEHYITQAKAHMDYAMTLRRGMESGRIRRNATHGDTKLDNFLFDDVTGLVRSLVDLDTVMPCTWLADWGDMARSLTNVAGEKEPDPAKIDVDLPVFEALARGYLSATRLVTRVEVELMVDAVRIISLELGVRFMTDYIRGDTYFTPGPADPPEINKIRAIAQITLFERVTELAPRLKAIIAQYATQA